MKYADYRKDSRKRNRGGTFSVGCNFDYHVIVSACISGWTRNRNVWISRRVLYGRVVLP